MLSKVELVQQSRSLAETERLRIFRSALTPAERFVLNRLAEGDMAKDIARKRGNSVRTIEVHIRRVRMRLGARTIGHAVAIGIVTGIIQFEVPE